MTTNAIRCKLTEYIRDADPKKLKAIYTLVQEDVAQRQDEEEIDDELLAELDRRSEEINRQENIMTVAESDGDIFRLIESLQK